MKIGIIRGRTHRDDGAAMYIEKFLNATPDVTAERVYVDDYPEKWPEGYDWFLMVDWGGDNFPDKPHLPYPPNTVCWQSDTHWTPDAFAYRFNEAAQCRIPCVCQYNAAQEFMRNGIKEAFWLPHAVDHTVYTPVLRDYSYPFFNNLPPDPDHPIWKDLVVDTVPKHDLAWVGFIGDGGRDAALERMFKEFPNFNFRTGVFFQRAARVYGNAKIAFNIAVRGELNMRTFEVMATRTLLLADNQIGMDRLGFKDGENCALYRTLDEAIEKAKYYLAHDDERRRVADNGYRFVLKSHTYQHRAKALLDIMEKCGRVST